MASFFRDSAAYHETVSSGAEVTPFLLKHIPALTGIDSLDVEPDVNPGDEFVVYEKGGYVNAEVLSIGSATIFEPECPAYTIGNLMVGSPSGNGLRGKGVGALGMKSHLARATETESGVIYINTVIGDGFSFWPAMGAIPLQEDRKMATLIDEGLSWYSVPYEERRLLEQIATTARSSPYLAFRLLARISTKGRSESYKTIREGTIENLGVVGDWFLLPAEPATNALLKDKLGALPDFPTVDKNHSLYGASRQLAHAPKALRALHI